MLHSSLRAAVPKPGGQAGESLIISSLRKGLLCRYAVVLFCRWQSMTRRLTVPSSQSYKEIMFQARGWKLPKEPTWTTTTKPKTSAAKLKCRNPSPKATITNDLNPNPQSAFPAASACWKATLLRRRPRFDGPEGGGGFLPSCLGFRLELRS